MTILFVLLFGWLAGGLANWAADVLPHWGHPQTDRSLRPANLAHDWTLWWFAWRRDCPHCGQPRRWRAPVLELAMLLLFLFTWRLWGQSPLLLAVGWLYGAFFLTVLVIDYEQRRVLNMLLAPAALVALALSFVLPTLNPIQSLLGGGAGLGLFLVFAFISRGALGAGDVKLAVVIGLMTGYPAVLTALTLGTLLAGVAAIALLLSRRATRKSTMAYAPYMAIGALVTLWGTLGMTG